MKKGIHPDNYRTVAFQDTSNDEIFLIRSTAPSNETIKVDGTEYPLVAVHTSSKSHPFYTGSEKLMDVEGRVDKFKARQAAAEAKKKAAQERHAKKSTAKKSDKADKKPTTQKLGR